MGPSGTQATALEHLGANGITHLFAHESYISTQPDGSAGADIQRDGGSGKAREGLRGRRHSRDAPAHGARPRGARGGLPHRLRGGRRVKVVMNAVVGEDGRGAGVSAQLPADAGASGPRERVRRIRAVGVRAGVSRPRAQYPRRDGGLGREGRRFPRVAFDQWSLRRIARREGADCIFSTANFGVLYPPVPQVTNIRNPVYFSRDYYPHVRDVEGAAAVLRVERAAEDGGAFLRVERGRGDADGRHAGHAARLERGRPGALRGHPPRLRQGAVPVHEAGRGRAHRRGACEARRREDPLLPEPVRKAQELRHAHGGDGAAGAKGGRSEAHPHVQHRRGGRAPTSGARAR